MSIIQNLKVELKTGLMTLFGGLKTNITDGTYRLSYISLLSLSLSLSHTHMYVDTLCVCVCICVYSGIGDILVAPNNMKVI